MAFMSTGVTLHGKPLSPGIGRGKAVVHRSSITRLGEFYQIGPADVEAECRRVDDAAKQVKNDLATLAESAESMIGTGGSEVFQAHKTMTMDPDLLDRIKNEIEVEEVSAGRAVRIIFKRLERQFNAMEADCARAKADDMQDLMRQFVRALAGIRGHELEGLPSGSVLIASRLMPTDIFHLLRCRATAVVLDAGCATSHAVIFARECGLPCVGGIPADTAYSDRLVLVDGYDGSVVIDPWPEQQRAFMAKHEQYEQAQVQARVHAFRPATTRAGRTIGVLANIGRVEDTQNAVANGADGIGLYRIEQACLGLQTFPDTATLRDELCKTLRPAQGLPVVVRLLDIGADKSVPLDEEQSEPNPALGCRGIRFLLKHPDLLQTQIDALLQLAPDFDLSILVPMVTLSSDMQYVNQQLQLSAARMKISPTPKLGAMIETPASAMAAGEIARYADFLSIGTNDLTQYTFAADRQNSSVDAYFNDAHDIIFRLIKIIREEAPQTQLSLCGELASRPECTGRILEHGVTSLSVSPGCVPEIKQAVRKSETACLSLVCS
ncbi:MAG: phosphoenolpyruvate--protein phosphotransferase [Spartobacteria bacterium]|nr:phosphoenolpyruvate--protein phosphotransferase [Spartobacteria bacterium]